MIREILPLPSIPNEILTAANDNKLVLFIGAGISRLAGAPNWDALADKVLSKLVDLGHLNYADVEQLSTLDPKKKLSIGLNISPNIRNSLRFDEMITPTKKESSIYDDIAKIGCSYVTTNYDNLLYSSTCIKQADIKQETVSVSGSVSPNIIFNLSEIKINLLDKKGTVFHLHGSLNNPEQMVLTTSDYLHRYSNDSYKSFLKHLFSRKTVLFIGYGLEELEILEFILKTKESNGKHFLLQGYYSHQQKTYEHLNSYYESTFNIEIIPFNMDEKKYKQQETILADWAAKISVGKTRSSDAYDWIMEAAVE